MKFSYLYKGVVASVFGAAMLLTGGTAQADYPCKEATFIVLTHQVGDLTKWPEGLYLVLRKLLVLV